MITIEDLLLACTACTGFGILCGMVLMILTERCVMRKLTRNGEWQ